MKPLLPIVAAALAAAVPSQLALAERQTQRVAMKNVAFSPDIIRAHIGDTLEWGNADIAAHTATSKEGGFDVAVQPGRSGSTIVKRLGTFSYICRYHPNMTGQVVVEP